MLNVVRTILFWLSISQCCSLVTYRFVQGNFSVSKKGTCINPFFTIKPLSRETTALSAGCGRLSRTLPKVYLLASMEYKRNFGNYRQVMNIPPFELCDSASVISHPFFSFLTKWIIPVALEKKCPLKGDDFIMGNLTHAPDMVSIWPDGYYRTSLTLYDDIDECIFNATSVFKISNTNNIKEF